MVLDVLYRAGDDPQMPRSNELAALSRELNELPIHDKRNRPANFRNRVGIRHQIESFLLGNSETKSRWKLGSLFFIVDDEYRDNLDFLHKIADAIRRNVPFLVNYPFGNILEHDGFPEGAILGHLHRMIEKRDSKNKPLSHRCDVCQLELDSIYNISATTLEHHLLVPPEELDVQTKYPTGKFITVCPNCHAAIHKYRPWIRKDNYEVLFR